MKYQSYSTITPINDTPFELVERKGIGHPDTLVDGIAEAISIEYSKYCLNHFGAVLHHNLDKISIIGGLVDLDFGKGIMTKPAKLILNGRMSVKFGDIDIDIRKLQTDVAKNYIKRVLPHMDTENWIEYNYFTNSYSHNPHWYYPRSVDDLPDFKRPYANDTSTCAGYWPLSITENLSLALEGSFYDELGLPTYEYIGQDIKVMSIRRGKEITATLCIPFISTKTPSVEFYKSQLKVINEKLTDIANQLVPDNYTVKVFTNTVDNDDRGSYYTLLTGSCLEAGEEGVVGRGNRSRGTISSTRPYSMEASNGKNPVYFVGKVHTVIADALAEEIGKSFNCDANVYISTKNGEDLYSPSTLIVDTSRKIEKSKLDNIVQDILSRRNWTKRIIEEKLLLPKTGNLYIK